MTGRPHTVIRYAEWTLGPERDEHGRARTPVREVLCETCAQRSGPRHGQEHTDTWALRHAGLTGHRGYLEITTASLTAHPAPTNPLYEAEQQRHRAS